MNVGYYLLQTVIDSANSVDIYDVGALMAVTTAVTEAVKRVAPWRSDWAPLVAIAIGLLVTGLYGLKEGADYGAPAALAEMAWTGIVLVGLGSAGLYSAAKHTVQAASQRPPDPPPYIQ